MRNLNLTKVALMVVVATQLMGADAFAGARFKETLLTRKKEAVQDPYFQIKSKTIRELTAEESLEFNNNDDVRPGLTTKQLVVPGGIAGPVPTPKAGVLDGVIMVVDKLIAIGQKIIPTIEKGKAVVTNNPMSAVSVLPRIDTKDPVVHDMGGWTIPKTKHYKITYKNGFGYDVVTFVYSITYQYNGTYGGKGKYLTGIRASARNINISWGFDLDASSQLLQISNVGTQQNIIAGATIDMSYTVKNWTRTITTNESFFIAGDGRLYKLD